MARPHLLLINLGTPSVPEPAAVREFLLEFLSDPYVVDVPSWLWRPLLRRVVLRRRPHRVSALYRAIWTDGGSPLRVGTERMVDGLRRVAADRFTVSAAYRYGQPSIETELSRLARESTGPIVAVPLFPQRTASTTGTAFARVREVAARAGIGDRVHPICVQPDDAGYIAALAARVEEGLTAVADPPEHLVISFHGIPLRYDRRERHQYTQDCERTTRSLLSAIGWAPDRATLSYQSKFGFERWLTPSTEATLAALPGRGVQRVAVITPGFVTDGLETLEEIDIRGRETFMKAGGTSFLSIRAADAHSALLGALVNMVPSVSHRHTCFLADIARGPLCCAAC